jgi:hypothetical protein
MWHHGTAMFKIVLPLFASVLVLVACPGRQQNEIAPCNVNSDCFFDEECVEGICKLIPPPAQDAGPLRIDAGTVPDSGSPEDGGDLDAGVSLDAGAPPDDGGAPLDAGTAADAGPLPESGPAQDSGIRADAAVFVDGGNLLDAGAGQDAGAPMEAGVAIDAGASTDAGNLLDAGEGEDAALPQDAGPPTPPWCLPAYSRRIKMTFDQNTVAEDIEPFVVAVYLNATNFDFSLAGGNGDGIRFVDAEGCVELPFEIESYNGAAQQGLIWVQVPKLNQGDLTDHLWLYTGPDGGEVSPPADNIWNGTYHCVFHMKDDNKDSAGDCGPATPSGFSNNMGATHIHANPGADAVVFDGVNDWFALNPSSPVLQNATEFSLSVWGRPDAAVATTLVGLTVTDTQPTRTSRGSIATLADRRIRMVARTTDTNIKEIRRESATGTVPIGTFVGIASTVDIPADEILVYLQGSSIATTNTGDSNVFTNNATPNTPPWAGSIGADEDGTQEYFSGTLTEVRIAKKRLLPHELRANHLAIMDELLSHGPVESRP